MWGRKRTIPEEEEAIPEDVIQEVFDRMKPMLEDVVNEKISQHMQAFAEKLKQDLGKMLVMFDKQLRETRAEVEEIKQVSGLSIDKVMRDILSAQTFAIAREAAKEVIEEIGVGRIQFMESYITDMETRVDELISTVSEVEKVVNEFKESAREIKSDLSKERQELAKVRSSLAELSKHVRKDLSQELETLKEEIRSTISLDGVDASRMVKESVEAVFREKLTAIEERLYEAVQNIQHVAESVSGLAVVAEKFEELEAAIASLSEEVRRLENKVCTMDNLEKKAEDVKKSQNARIKEVPEEELENLVR